MGKKYELSFQIKKYINCETSKTGLCSKKFKADFEINLDFLPSIGDIIEFQDKKVLVVAHKRCFPECNLSKDGCDLQKSVFYGKYIL